MGCAWCEAIPKHNRYFRRCAKQGLQSTCLVRIQHCASLARNPSLAEFACEAKPIPPFSWKDHFGVAWHIFRFLFRLLQGFQVPGCNFTIFIFQGFAIGACFAHVPRKEGQKKPRFGCFASPLLRRVATFAATSLDLGIYSLERGPNKCSLRKGLKKVKKG